MKRLLLFLCLCASTFAADGDIYGASVETNGWTLDLWIVGNSSTYTNGAFSFGFGANNTLTANQKLVLTTTSCGFNDDGTTNQTIRTIYDTRQLRYPYPNQAYNDTSIDGSNIKLRIGLNEYIYAWDVSLTANILSGHYATNALTSASASSLSVTNTSINDSPKPVANWAPGFFGGRVFGSTADLRVIGGHWSARLGRPLRAVEFVVQGITSGVLATNWQTVPKIDWTYGDQVPVIEYIGSVDLSGMTDGEKLRCNFTAFPWIGTNTLSTTDGVNSNPPEYATITNVCNRAGAYGGAEIVLDPVNGSDSTGVAYARGGTVAPACLTLDRAMKQIAATNNLLYGHNDCGGGSIIITNGQVGLAVNTSINDTPILCEITRHPNSPRSSVVITNAGKEPTVRLVYRDLTLSSAASLNYWSGTSAWFDNCTITNTTSSTFEYGAHPWMFTRCDISDLDTWSIQPRAAQNAPTWWVRGCLLRGTVSYQPAYMFVGNYLPGVANAPGLNQFYSTVPVTPCAMQPIWCFNKFMKVKAGSQGVLYTGNSTNLPYYGCLIAQNLIEKTNSADARLIFVFADSDEANQPTSNVMLWNNTFVGDRGNYAYNEEGTTAAWRLHFQLFGNYFSGLANKTDTFGTGNGNRIGNWSSVWGVLSRGHINSAIKAWGGDAAFAGIPGWDVQNAAFNWMDFVSAQYTDGTNPGNGGGNYRVLSNSPGLGLSANSYVLPFDIEGQYRGGFDAPGAYASASPRKGGGFFAP